MDAQQEAFIMTEGQAISILVALFLAGQFFWAGYAGRRDRRLRDEREQARRAHVKHLHRKIQKDAGMHKAMRHHRDLKASSGSTSRRRAYRGHRHARGRGGSDSMPSGLAAGLDSSGLRGGGFGGSSGGSGSSSSGGCGGGGGD
jgi:hypothetical protein